MQHAHAELIVAIQNDVTDLGLVPRAYDDQIASLETRLHARSFDDGVPRGAAELSRCEEEPGRAEQYYGDDRGRCSRGDSVSHERTRLMSGEAAGGPPANPSS